METSTRTAKAEVIQQLDAFDRPIERTSFDGGALARLTRFPQHWTPASDLASTPGMEPQLTHDPGSLQAGQDEVASMSLAEFVRRKFIPDFVEIKRSAGRAHFREILKNILLSERGDCGLAESYERTNVKRNAIETWPYMDSLRLCDIDEETIQHITSTALESGYSIQTATHIRNVIRAIYSHAIVACRYKGRNPATLVSMPAMAHKDAHSLTLAQLKQVMAAMRFPERPIALFSILTEMNLVEICGVQWQYVNLSADRHFVQEEWLPPKTIAVRNQWYRGEFRSVMGSRKRFVRVSELLCSILRDLKGSNQFVRPQDFVIASRSGSPIYPGNIAKRRLKTIGQSCDMPWLSWRVFHRTHLRLRAEFGRHFYKEIEKILPPQCP